MQRLLNNGRFKVRTLPLETPDLSNGVSIASPLTSPPAKQTSPHLWVQSSAAPKPGYHRDPAALYTDRTLQLVNGVQLPLGVEKASHVSTGWGPKILSLFHGALLKKDHADTSPLAGLIPSSAP